MNTEKILQLIKNHLDADKVLHLESTINEYGDLLRYKAAVANSLTAIVYEPKLFSNKPTLEELKNYSDKVEKRNSVLELLNLENSRKAKITLLDIYNNHLTIKFSKLLSKHDEAIKNLIYNDLNSNLNADKVYDNIKHRSIRNATVIIEEINYHYDAIENYLK